MNKTYLGIDIGGTAVKLGLISPTGEVLRRHSASVSFDGYRTPVLDTVLTETAAFLRALPAPPQGIGISAKGCMDAERGVVIESCLPGWNGIPLAAAMEAQTGLPASVENDARCMCLGEYWVGAGRGCDELLCVTIGTGIGGAMLHGGRLARGAHRLGGEIGHMVTHVGGRPCGCGRAGCWEQYASTTALLRMAREGGADAPDGRALLAQAAAGEATALAALDRWAAEAAEGLANLVFLLDPARILVGGGVAEAGELLLAPLRRALDARLMDAYRDGFTLAPAALGNDAGMIGAVLHHLRQTGQAKS